MDILKQGEITTKELLKIFGSKKLNERYDKEKRLGGKDKTAILKKANIFCNIEDLGKGKFIIHKVYSGLKNENVIALKKGLYKYFIPLILTKLLHEQDKNYKITLPFIGWARQFDIVNNNYVIMKYNQDESSKQFKINEDTMLEYFSKIDDCIKYYIEECLDKLSNKKTLNLIDYDKVTMGKFVYRDSEKNNSGVLEIFCKDEYRVLTDEEHKFSIDCEQEARIFAGIDQPKEIFYGEKSFVYKNKLKELLLQRDMLFTYSAYNVFCKNKEGIKEVIESFKYEDNCDFVKDFNEKFIEYTNNKAKLRQNKEIDKSNTDIDVKFLQEHRLLETYLDEISQLSLMTLKKDADDISSMIDISKNKKERIMEDFFLNIVRLN